MKSFKMVAAVATFMVTAGALAQTDNNAPAASTSASAASTSAGTTAPAASAAASSTASLEAAKPAARPFKMELYHSTETPMTNINYNKGISKTVNYVGVKGTVLNGKSLGIRQLFEAPFMSDDKRSNVKMGKTYIHFTDPKLFALQNGVEGMGILRAYLPTSETERFITKQQGSVRAYLIGAKSFGKIDLDVTLIGQAFANSQDMYTKPDGSRDSNIEFYGYPSLNAGYNLSKAVTIAQSLGVENMWYRAKPVERSFNSTTTVAWQAMPELKLMGNLSNDIAIHENGTSNAFALGREDEMSVLFEAAVSL